MIDLEWIEVPAGTYEIGLREDEARALAQVAARQAREAAARETDPLHGLREDRELEEMWGNPEYLYQQLAMSMPAHRVQLPAFALSKTPVTVAHYTKFRLATGAAPRATQANELSATPPRPPDPNEPVTGVPWYEARAFAEWAHAQLPSEAQWEAALRPASRSVFAPISDELSEWCADEIRPYRGAEPAAVARVVPPPGGWAGKRAQRGASIPGFPTTVVTRDAADPSLRLLITTFRIVVAR